MKIVSIILLISLSFFSFPNLSQAEKSLDFYMNDFYTKSNAASKILKEIETQIKEGSREKVCSRQRKAANLGILANKSLMKAFEEVGTEPPKEALKKSNDRWESLLKNCQKEV